MRSSSANWPQVGYRAAGFFASAVARTRSTAAGRSGRRAAAAGGGAYSCAYMTVKSWSGPKGGVPQSSSNAVQASE